MYGSFQVQNEDFFGIPNFPIFWNFITLGAVLLTKRRYFFGNSLGHFTAQPIAAADGRHSRSRQKIRKESSSSDFI